MTFLRLSPARLRTLGLALAALSLPTALLVAPIVKSRAEKPVARRQAGTSALTMPLAVAWKYTGNFYGSNPAAPVIVGDTAYYVSGNIVYAVNLQNGSQKWRYPSDVTATLPKFVAFSPAVANGKVFIGAPDGLYALSATDGSLLWRYAVPRNAPVSTVPYVMGNNVYFGSANGRLYGLDTSSGETLGGAFRQLGKPLGVDMGGDLGAEPAFMNGSIYYATSNSEFHVIDLSTGVQRWAVRLQADVRNATPVFGGEAMYLATGNVYTCWRPGNGSQKWYIQLPDEAAAPPAVDTDGTSYIITADRFMYAISTRAKGLWKNPPRLDNRPLTAPVLSGNLLIIPTALGGLYAYDKESGALKWSYNIQPSASNPAAVPNSTSIAAPPVVVGDTLYTLSDDGTLTAFRHDAPDTIPPVISELEPEQGDYLNGRPPFHIGAKIMDEGSGLDLSTLSLKLDDHEIPRRFLDSKSPEKDGFLFRIETGLLEYATVENEGGGKSNTLANGKHTVTIRVKDWMGNELVKSWLFTVDDAIKARPRNIQPNNAPNGFGNPGGGKGNSGGGPAGGKGGA